ncbi:MAG: hypothetical protein RR816_09325, partial [Clostridia bacterium]
LSILYASKAYWGWVSVRALSYLFETPIYAVLTYLTLRGLQKVKLPSLLHERGDEKELKKEKACESKNQPSSKS